MLKSTLYRNGTTRILPFNDGICTVHTIEKRTVKDNLGTFAFHEETIGIQSFTEFSALGIQIDKVISIPFNHQAEIGRVVKINDDINFYKIEMIQKKDTFPLSLRLTLTKTNISWNEDKNDKVFGN